MDLNKLMIDNYSDDDKTEVIINLIAFEGLKIATKNMRLGEYLVKTKVPSQIWRGAMAVFIGMPWELNKLDNDEYLLLKDIHEMLTV
uniref:Uncharacterized protein n=1 Tax=uncultured marine virus TaxID=186617 RepID=A0A0F7L900_9VIRU|nr:hypothetical protein [uncultured marine virus]